MEYAIRLGDCPKILSKRKKVLKNITRWILKIGEDYHVDLWGLSVRSGKTVLFKWLSCGFLQPESGTVLVGGKQIGKELDFSRIP